jgi:two-component system sensor histidine kinase UhpB
MREGMSLRFRLNLMIALTMLLIVGIGFGFAVHNARRSVEEEIGSTVNLALQLIEAGIGEARSAGRPLSEWLMQLGRLEHARHLRIRVAGASPEPIDLTGAGSGAEIAVPAWFRWSAAPDPIALEQRLPDGRGGEVTIRIEADADDEIAEAWQETQGFLVLLLVLAGAVYGLVHFTVGRAFRSVGIILQGLEGIEKGDYGKRLPGFPLPEFARIAEAFNHMAQVLEKSQAENHALIQQSIVIQEEERRHLARELHDELGQSLTAIKVMATTLQLGSLQNREAAGHILNLCDRLFGVFRGMMRRLRPSVLDELGLAASLEELVQDWRSSHPGLAIDFACESGVDDRAGNARIHLFRIVQEGLTNVVKHAGARQVLIRLQLEDEGSGPAIVLRFRDDGRGFDAADPGRPRRGFGLAGMRERVASLRGRFRLDTRPGRGVAIEIRIPAEREPEP